MKRGREMTGCGHEIVKCSCGTIISQCRCMDRNKTIRIVENGCVHCRGRLEVTPSGPLPNVPLPDPRDAEIARLKAEIERLTAELEHWFGCESCGERHPDNTLCPPHEVRTSGLAWFRERLQEAKQREDALKAERDRALAEIEAHAKTKTALELALADNTALKSGLCMAMLDIDNIAFSESYEELKALRDSDHPGAVLLKRIILLEHIGDCMASVLTGGPNNPYTRIANEWRNARKGVSQ